MKRLLYVLLALAIATATLGAGEFGIVDDGPAKGVLTHRAEPGGGAGRSAGLGALSGYPAVYPRTYIDPGPGEMRGLLINTRNYTRADTPFKVTLDDYSVTSTSVDRDENTYVYKDYTASYFSGDFTHQFKVNVSAGAVGGAVVHWALSDSVKNMGAAYTAGNSSILFGTWRDATDYKMFIYEVTGASTVTSDFGVYSVATDYFVVIERSSTTLNAYIYSNADKTTLVDTLSITLSAATAYRYHYIQSSFNTGASGQQQSATSSNHSLNPYMPYRVESKGLLVEPAGSNLLLNARTFTEAGGWTFTSTITSTADETGIDGTSNTAYTVNDGSTGTTADIRRTIPKSVSDSTTYFCASVFVKKATSTTAYPALFIHFGTVAARFAGVVIDTVNGTLTEHSAANAANRDETITDHGDWWKVSIWATDNGANELARWVFYPAINADASANSNNSTTGSNIIDAGQFELTAYPTSYIDTDGMKLATMEDFSGYAEQDALGRIAVYGTDAIVLTAGDRDEDYYISGDEGAGNIGDFTYQVVVNVTSLTDDAASIMYPWGVAESHDDFYDIDAAAAEDAIFINAARATAATYTISLLDLQAGTLTQVDTSAAIAVGTESYLTITRSGATVTVEIYSSEAKRAAGGAGDVDTITGTCNSTAFRYVYGMGSYNSGVFTGKDISGWTANLTLDSDIPQRVRIGGFDVDSQWTKGTNWTIGAGVATKAATNATALEQDIGATANHVYQLIYTATRTAGTLTPSIGGVNGTAISASGTYVDYITASGTGNLKFTADATFAGTVDDVSVVEHGMVRQTENTLLYWTMPTTLTNQLAESLGAETITAQADRDFSGASNWANQNLDSYDETGDLTITANGVGQYCYLPAAAVSWVDGQLYKISFDLANVVSSWILYTRSANITIGTVSTNATHSFYFTYRDNVGGNGNITIVAGGAASSGDFDNFTIKPVTRQSQGAMVAELTPGEDDVSGNMGLVAVSDAAASLLYFKSIAGTDRLYSYDATTEAQPTVTLTPGTTITVVVRWGYIESGVLKFNVGSKTGSTWSWGSGYNFDGAYALGTDLVIGYGNTYPFHIGNIQFFETTMDQTFFEGRYP